MVDLWLHDIESLEAVTQDEHTKRLCLRMAAMSQAGTLAPFIANLHHDDELDDSTKGTLAEIADDANFLLALEDYVRSADASLPLASALDLARERSRQRMLSCAEGMGDPGFEPGTSALSERRSNQLS